MSASKDEKQSAFPYTPRTTMNCMIDTERELRDLIDDILVEKYGLDWETNAKTGFSAKIQSKIRERMKHDSRRVGIHFVSGRYIDYSYIDDLRTLVSRHWELFKGVFHSKQKTEHLFDELIKRRDFIAHGRDKFELWEYYLCLGACGQLQALVRNWYLGFKRSVKLYTCVMAFGGESKRDYMDQLRSENSLEKWMEAVKNIHGAKIEERSKDRDGSSVRETLLRFPGGHAKIVLLPRSQDWDDSLSLKLETHSPDVLTKILEKGNHPYRKVIMTLAEKLDLHKIQQHAKMARRRNLALKTKNKKLISIKFILDEFDHENKVLASLSEGALGSNIEIVSEGSRKIGFFRAHEVFSLDTVLGILYYNLKPARAHRLVLESLKKNEMKNTDH